MACRNLTGQQSGNHAVLLALAVLALTIPSLFSHSIGPDTSQDVEAELRCVRGHDYPVCIRNLYSLRSARSPITYVEENKAPSQNGASARQ